MNEEQARQVATAIIGNLSGPERTAIDEWLTSLIQISRGDWAMWEKASALNEVTRNPRILRPLAHLIIKELRGTGLDQLSWPMRPGLAAALISAGAVGGQGSGIAALGNAIALPLWIVFGPGGVFAGVAVDELRRKSHKQN